MNFRSNILVYLSTVTAMVCWAFTFIWYKQVYPQLTPITVVTLRLLFATLILVLLSITLKKLEPLIWKDLPQFLLLTFFEPFIYFLGESFGLKYLSSSLASLMIAAIPLIVPIAAWYYFREKLTIFNYVGIIFSIIGVYLVIISDHGTHKSTLFGVLLMTLAILSTIGFSVFVKKLSDKYSPFTIVVYQNLFGFVFFLPLFLIVDSHKFLNQIHHTNITVYIPVIKLALFGSVIAFILFIYSISRIGIAKANVFTNLIPVFTSVFAYFILKEKYTFIKLVGISIVITGLILSQIGQFMSNNNKE